MKAQSAFQNTQATQSNQTPRPQLQVQTQNLPPIITQPLSALPTGIFNSAVQASVVAQPASTPFTSVEPYIAQWTPYNARKSFIDLEGTPQPSPSVQEEILVQTSHPDRVESSPTVPRDPRPKRRQSHPPQASTSQRGRNTIPKSTINFNRKRKPST